MCRYNQECEYTVGKNIKLKFLAGKKEKKDYVVQWSFDSGKSYKQFTDKDLFNKLVSKIQTKEEDLKFIKYFCDYQNIDFDKECINLAIDNVQDVISYVQKSTLDDELRLCVACMLFRCDIDNINYPCTRYNGCIRHFVQVLMLFGYKFDIDEFKISKLCIKKKDDIVSVISDIGYPNNNYNITTKDFKDAYTNFIKHTALL